MIASQASKNVMIVHLMTVNQASKNAMTAAHLKAVSHLNVMTSAALMIASRASKSVMIVHLMTVNQASKNAMTAVRLKAVSHLNVMTSAASKDASHQNAVMSAALMTVNLVSLHLRSAMIVH